MVNVRGVSTSGNVISPGLGVSPEEVGVDAGEVDVGGVDAEVPPPEHPASKEANMSIAKTIASSFFMLNTILKYIIQKLPV
jgi:hypothetical protein